MKKTTLKGWKKVLLIIIPYLLFTLIAQFSISKIANIETVPIPTSSEDMLALFLAAFVGTFFVVWLFMKFIDREPFLNVGFEKYNWVKELICGILVGLILIGSGFFLLKMLGEISIERFNFDIKEILIALLISACVAIAEELIFRGYILKNLLTSFNKFIALIFSAILFTLIHIGNPDISVIGYMNLFLAGFFLGIFYIYTKRLWFPIGLHFAWNLFQGLFGFNISGVNSYSIVEFRISENNYLNGGNNGFEGSMLSIVAQIITIVVIIIYFKRKTNHNKT